VHHRAQARAFGRLQRAEHHAIDHDDIHGFSGHRDQQILPRAAVGEQGEEGGGRLQAGHRRGGRPGPRVRVGLKPEPGPLDDGALLRVPEEADRVAAVLQLTCDTQGRRQVAAPLPGDKQDARARTCKAQRPSPRAPNREFCRFCQFLAGPAEWDAVPSRRYP
jgi:hypothetical protein